jgi:hypothetical protein
MRRQHKYHAVATVVDNVRFASKAEAWRYQELKLLEKAGEIEGLELQPEFLLKTQLTTGTVIGAGRALAGNYPVIGKYRADFAYYDNRTGQRVVEDVKGFKTPLYRWKKKHVEAQYGLTITEITQ